MDILSLVVFLLLVKLDSTVTTVNGHLKLNTNYLDEQQQYIVKFNQSVTPPNPNPGRPKVILFWTSYFGMWNYNFGLGQQPFIDAGCGVTNCYLTHNRSYELQADALIFHLRNYKSDTVLPEFRNINQRYILFSLESPRHINGLHIREVIPPGYFNWTMSYRLDSDVVFTYGHVKKGATPINRPYFKLESTKRKPIAWFASDCNTYSRREKYVKELQKYIPVDIYGACGPLKCPANKTGSYDRSDYECYHMLENDYYFYLSFENIFCEDYVTEKLYNILNYFVVPVVMGWGKYDKVAPPHSVIDIEDYASPEELAIYLNDLMIHKVKYREYFLWKNDYHVLNMMESHKKGFCDLCEKLNKPNLPSQSYVRLYDWWGEDTRCELTKWQF